MQTRAVHSRESVGDVFLLWKWAGRVKGGAWAIFLPRDVGGEDASAPGVHSLCVSMSWTKKVKPQKCKYSCQQQQDFRQELSPACSVCRAVAAISRDECASHGTGSCWETSPLHLRKSFENCSFIILSHLSPNCTRSLRLSIAWRKEVEK